MPRILLTTLTVIMLLACTRNPEGAGRRRTNARPAAEPEIPSEAPATEPLPPGHPPIDGLGQGAGAVAPRPAGDQGAVVAGVAGLRWDAPSPFTFRQPTSSMRAAEYIIDGGDESTVLTVFFFGAGGGGIQANIDRWVGQMQTSDDRPPEITRTMVAGLSVTKVDVHGGFSGMQAPGQEAGGTDAGFRMLGAIVEGPEGPVFFKLVGPSSTVDLAAEAFDGLIASFHAAS